MTASVDEQALRALVREVLRELLPAPGEPAGAQTALPGAATDSAASDGAADSAVESAARDSGDRQHGAASGSLTAAAALAPPQPGLAHTVLETITHTGATSGYGDGGSTDAAAAVVAPPQPGLAHTVRENAAVIETVSMRTDQDLAAFALRLLHLFENPKHRDDLRAGRLRFRLAAHTVAGAAAPTHRIDKGAVTESVVIEAARAGARIVLGRRAVLTPLARDRARASGVQIDKER